LHEVSPLRKLAYFEHALVWPMAHREIFLQACGMVLKSERAGVLTMSSVEGDEWFGHKLERNSSNVNCDIHKAFMHVQYVSEEKCRLKMILNCNPHLSCIPQSLINFFLKNVIGHFVTLVQKKSQTMGDEYTQLQEEKKEFYDVVKEKMS